jgi:uncharacterized membrane-anchored protein
MSSKLPRVVALFWVMKIAATTLGETASDHLAHTLELGYATTALILVVGFGALLAWQLFSDKHRPFLFWSVILATSILGTALSDFMDRTLKLGYATGSAILVVLLATVFAYWRKSAGTLSVTDIRTRRDETLYWTAILISNTLGTALGDYLADDSGLGFAGGAALIGGLLALTLVLHFATKISKVALFWIAFVLTRPFGATLGDVLTKKRAEGGLDLGTLQASGVLLAILIASILYSQYRDKQLAD